VTRITCPMCGTLFDPAQLRSCDACPMHKGCASVCCPECGYSTVDPGRSRVVALSSRLGRLVLSRRRLRARAGALTLADVAAGTEAMIDGLEGLSSESRHQLQAYGLAPGRTVRIVQQSPLTVVRVEHLDLAFEPQIARGVLVRGVGEGSVPVAAEAALAD
jgi:Fe2+ transport system protein FeoA